MTTRGLRPPSLPEFAKEPNATRVQRAARFTSDTPFGVQDRIFLGLLFAAIEDALVATGATWSPRVGPFRAVAAGLEVFLFLAFPLVAVGFPLAFLLNRPSARTFLRHARIGLSGGRPEAAGLASFLYAVVLTGGLALAWGIGFRASDFQSARVATLVSTLMAVALLFGGAFVVAAVAGPLDSLARRVSQRLPKGLPVPGWLPAEDTTIALVFVVTLHLLLPPSHAMTPSAGVIGFAFGPHIAARVPSLAATARLRFRLFVPIALFLTVGASLGLKHLPGSVQMGVLARAPYASIIIKTMRCAFDTIATGSLQSSWECNDRNAAIRPNALDAHDNGLASVRPTVQSAVRDMKAPALR